MLKKREKERKVKKYLRLVLICDLFLATIKSTDKRGDFINLANNPFAILLEVFMTEVNRGFFYPQAM